MRRPSLHSGKVDVPREFISKRVYVIVVKD